MTFSPGSVVVNYVALFTNPEEPIGANVVTEALKLAVSNNDFGNYTVDPESIRHTRKSIENDNTILVNF